MSLSESLAAARVNWEAGISPCEWAEDSPPEPGGGEKEKEQNTLSHSLEHCCLRLHTLKLFKGPLSASRELTVFPTCSLKSQIWLIQTAHLSLWFGPRWRAKEGGTTIRPQGACGRPWCKRPQGCLTAKLSCLPTLPPFVFLKLYPRGLTLRGKMSVHPEDLGYRAGGMGRWGTHERYRGMREGHRLTYQGNMETEKGISFCFLVPSLPFWVKQGRAVLYCCYSAQFTSTCLRWSFIKAVQWTRPPCQCPGLSPARTPAWPSPGTKPALSSVGFLLTHFNKYLTPPLTGWHRARQ